jgi:tripartite-type tricarboxylate transporter receptor subunit TctC
MPFAVLTARVHQRAFLAACVTIAVVVAILDRARAEDYPSRPLTMVVPFPAGGPTDTLARILTDRMSVTLGQPIIIENVGGASGSLGVGRVVHAAPDGYTIGIGQWGTHVLNGGIYSLPYDLLRDLEPVAEIASGPQIIVAKKTLAAANLSELVDWLRAHPNQAAAGTVGAGSGSHVAAVFFQNKTQTQFQFVPYRGSAPAMADLVAGHIDFMFDQASNSLPQVRSGNIKAFAVTAKTRLSSAPDIPTVDEAGLPELYIAFWHGLWVPKDTPRGIVARINAAVVHALADPTVRDRYIALGQEIPTREQQTPEALAAFQKAEIEKWWPIVKAAKIKAD